MNSNILGYQLQTVVTIDVAIVCLLKYLIRTIVISNKVKFLSYEEIIQISTILKKIGLKKIRITGGEPLLRKNIDKLIYKLKNEVGIKDVSMTTNGSLLTDKKLNELKASGLDSVTLSLDTLHFDKTVQINGTKKNI